MESGLAPTAPETRPPEPTKGTVRKDAAVALTGAASASAGRRADLEVNIPPLEPPGPARSPRLLPHSHSLQETFKCSSTCSSCQSVFSTKSLGAPPCRRPASPTTPQTPSSLPPPSPSRRRMSMPGYMSSRGLFCSNRVSRQTSRVSPLPGEGDGRSSWTVARRAHKANSQIGAALQAPRCPGCQPFLLQAASPVCSRLPALCDPGCTVLCSRRLGATVSTAATATSCLQGSSSAAPPPSRP